MLGPSEGNCVGRRYGASDGFRLLGFSEAEVADQTSDGILGASLELVPVLGGLDGSVEGKVAETSSDVGSPEPALVRIVLGPIVGEKVANELGFVGSIVMIGVSTGEFDALPLEAAVEGFWEAWVDVLVGAPEISTLGTPLKP